jgi:hypothetical protein
MDLLSIAGLVGVVLVISTGKVFDPLRDWLKSFVHPLNPGPWLAALISCSMCSGVWVGALWAVVNRWPWSAVIVYAGIISLLSYVMDELLGLLNGMVLRLTQGMPTRRNLALLEQNQQRMDRLMMVRRQVPLEPRRVAPGNDISEDEADALLDEETGRADAAA